MSDQAQGLRTLADQSRRDHGNPSASPSIRRSGELGPAAYDSGIPADMGSALVVADGRRYGTRRARVIAVTSGKGGVGKTNFSTNLAVTLAHLGQRVIVLDADLGLANVHVVMGINPRFHVEHVMRGERTLREILYPGPSGIQVIAGGSGITELANLDEATRNAFVASLAELDYLADVVLIDTGAGLSNNVLSFLCAVDEVIVLTTPEPTAMTDAYATIKVVSHENRAAQLMLVVNMAQSEDEATAVVDKLTTIARQFLHVEIDSLGCIPYDVTVARAVRAQQPFTISQPNSPAARAVAQIAAQLGYRETLSERSDGGSGVGGLLNRMHNFFGRRDAAAARR